MLVLNAQVFDEIIEGTGTTWHTSAVHNGELGAPDGLVVFVSARDVSGSSPTVSVFLDSSGDNRSWVEGGSPIVSGGLSNGVVLTGKGASRLSFARLRISLGGSSPKCRLKLSVTGRVF